MKRANREDDDDDDDDDEGDSPSRQKELALVSPTACK